MGTFLYKAALGLLLVQTPDGPQAAPRQDTLRTSVWARVMADSTDGSAWLEVGRYYLQLGDDYHAHKKPMVVDSAWAHGVLDTAQLAFDRATRLSTGTRTADSARVFRVFAF